jgi:hypothetical protein
MDSDHQCGEVARVLVCFGAQIGEIDIAIFQTCDRNNFEPGHDRTGLDSFMRRSWDETNVTMRFTTRCVILPDREQTCESPCDPALAAMK